MTKPENYSEQDLTNVLLRTIEVISGRDSDKATAMPIEQLLTECKTHILSIPISWNFDQLIITETSVNYLIPLLRAFKDTLSQARAASRMKAEMSKE